MDHRVPGRGAAQGRGRVPGAAAARAWRPASSRCSQKCPHLGCRVPQCAAASGSSARATARSTTGSARRRVARRHAAWITSGHDRQRHGDVVIDTGTVVHGPAHRHEHHRPRSRRPALHELAASTDEPFRSIGLTTHDHRLWPSRRVFVITRSVGWSTSSRTGVPAQPELGSEIELAPNRKPYYDDEMLEGPTPRARAAARRAAAGASWSSACRCTGCSSPGARPAHDQKARQRFVAWGSELFATDCRRRLQLRRLPRRHGRRGGAAPYTITDPLTRRGAGGQLERAGAQHRALPLRRERGQVHPRLRPAVLADVAVGPRRRRPDERPADREPHRVHQEHPDPPRGLRRGRGSARSATRARCPRTSGRHRRPPPSRQSSTATRRRWARRCSTSTSPVVRTLRPLPHQGWSYGEPGVSGRRLRLEPHRVVR